MTGRGRAVLLLGVFCWIIAVVFGSPALYPVAAGLVIVVPLAVAWVRITLRQPHLSRRWRQEDAVWRNDQRGHQSRAAVGFVRRHFELRRGDRL